MTSLPAGNRPTTSPGAPLVARTVPLDPSYVGRSYPYPEPYTVGVEKIREFAAAIGDDNPMCHDRAVARAAWPVGEQATPKAPGSARE